MIRLTLITAATLALIASPATFAQAPEVLVGTLYQDAHYGDAPDHLRVYGDNRGYAARPMWARPTMYVSYPQYYSSGYYHGSYPRWSARNLGGEHVVFGTQARVGFAGSYDGVTISVGTGSGYYYGWPVVVSQSTRCDRSRSEQCTPGYGGYRDPACGWTNRNLDVVHRATGTAQYGTTGRGRSGHGSLRTGSTSLAQPQRGISRAGVASGRRATAPRPSPIGSFRTGRQPVNQWSQTRSVYRGTNVRGATRQAAPVRHPTIRPRIGRGWLNGSAAVRRGPSRTAVQRGSFRTGSGAVTRDRP